MAILDFELTKFYVAFFAVQNLFGLINVKFIEPKFEDVNV